MLGRMKSGQETIQKVQGCLAKKQGNFLVGQELVFNLPRDNLNKNVFYISYNENSACVEGVYERATKGLPNSVPRVHLISNVKDIAVDFACQGRSKAQMLVFSTKNSIGITNFIRNDSKIMNYEASRVRIPYLENFKK